MTLTIKKNRALKRGLRNKRTAKANKTVDAPRPAQNISNEPAYTLSTDIPTSYNDTYVRAIPKDPQNTFVFWNMSNSKAIETGIPEKGNVCAPNEKAAWLMGNIAEHTKPIPPTIPSVFETQQQNAQQATPEHAPPDGGNVSVSSNTESISAPPAPPPEAHVPWVIPPTRPCGFENYEPPAAFAEDASVAYEKSLTHSQNSYATATPDYKPPSAAALSVATSAALGAGATLTKRQYDLALEIILALANKTHESALMHRAMSSGIFYNANAEKSL